MGFRKAFFAAVALLASANAVAEPLNNAGRWTRAKFQGISDDNAAPAHSQILARGLVLGGPLTPGSPDADFPATGESGFEVSGSLWREVPSVFRTRRPLRRDPDEEANQTHCAGFRQRDGRSGMVVQEPQRPWQAASGCREERRGTGANQGEAARAEWHQQLSEEEYRVTRRAGKAPLLWPSQSAI